MQLTWITVFVTAFQLVTLTNGACTDNPTGISEELKVIPDESMTSSSNNGNDFLPQSGRLNNANAWCANASNLSDTNPYLQIDLGIDYDICTVAVQGMPMDNNTVTNFNLSYSSDGSSFTLAREFDGTSLDGDEVELHNLTTTITARYIRFLPDSKDICLRVEVYGVPNGVQVECKRFEMVISISHTTHPSLSSADSVKLNESCDTTNTADADTTTVTATLGDCGTYLIISEDGSTAFYTNQIINNSTDVKEFDIICSYVRSSVDVLGTGTLGFSMGVFTDNNYSTALSNSIVSLEQMLYFQTEVDAHGGNTLHLFLEKCWATPTNDSGSNQYRLITLGCQTDNSYTTYICDSSSNIQRFQLEVFRFSGSSSNIYIHCDVIACLEGDSSSVCVAPCCDSKKRRKRSLEESFEDKSKVQSMVLGPFIIVDDRNNNDDDDRNNNDDDDTKDKEPTTVDPEDGEGIAIYVIVIVAVSGSIGIIVIVGFLLVLMLPKGSRGPTVKDVTSELAIDNLAFDDLDVKTISIKPNGEELTT